MEKQRSADRSLVGNPEGKSMEDLDVDGKIILKCVFEKRAWGREMDGTGSREGQGTRQDGNETSGSIKCGEFSDQLRN